MATTRQLSLELRLVVDGTHLAGVLRRPGTDDRPFSGWLGLMAVVEDAQRELAAAPTDPRRTTP